MADSSAPSPPLGVPISVWLTLILSIAGVFAYTQRPFQDARPSNAGAALNYHAASYGQNVEARLWADPLSAVAAALKAHPGLAAANPDTLLTDGGAGGHHTLLMGVMVSGAPYADDIEARRRARNAVLAGLYRSAFLPQDPQHIGYLCTDTPPAATSPKCPDGDAHTLAAFEWLARQPQTPGSEKTPAADRVLVLWLDQDQFRQMPLLTLSQLLRRIRGINNPDVSYAVLGPADSDGLRQMQVEAAQNGSDAKWLNSIEHMVLYSSRATASDASVLGSPTENAPRTVAEDLNTHSGGRVEFLRTVANDDEVAQAIITELRLRDIRPYEVALVAERDTLYARGMGRYFKGCDNRPRQDPLHGQPSPVDTGVLCFTYLKGLDGLGPAPAPAASADAGAKIPSAKPGAPSEGASSDASIGPSQLDYLRRLAATIADLNRSSTRVQAIGVISSDVYDKLLVLQALRAAMPTRTYFTFDLDARLLEPGNLRSTRQLLVGSSLGLTLCPELQGDVPPFRDVYQTTTYFATLMAVYRYQSTDLRASAPPAHGCTTVPTQGNAPPARASFDPERAVQIGFEWTQHPRVFQIGRTAAFDLNGPSGATCNVDSDCESISAVRTTWMWNDRHFIFKGLLVGLGLALVVLAGGAFALGSRALRGYSRTRQLPLLGLRRWHNGYVALAIVIFVLALSVAVWPWIADHVTQHFARVPTPLFSGANEWTTSVVDVLTIVLVVLLVMRGQRKLHDNADEVSREFGFRNSRIALVRWHRKKLGPGRVRSQYLTLFWFPLWPLSRTYGADLADATVSPLEALIAQYLNRGTALARFLRVIATAALSVALLVALEAIPGLTSFRRLFEGISLVSLFAMQFLILWTADALLLSRSFILALWRDNPAWPQETLTRTSTALGMSAPQVSRWLDLRLIALRTSCVANLVWYPSCVIALVAISTLLVEFRAFQFANNPIALAAGALFVIAAAVALRMAAEDFRKGVQHTYEDAQLSARFTNVPLAAQLDQLIDRVQALRQGAFAPYSEQPIVRAVLVPVLTYGATVSLQSFHLGP